MIVGNMMGGGGYLMKVTLRGNHKMFLKHILQQIATGPALSVVNVGSKPNFNCLKQKFNPNLTASHVEKYFARAK
jgi:hypothetical protein